MNFTALKTSAFFISFALLITHAGLGYAEETKPLGGKTGADFLAELVVSMENGKDAYSEYLQAKYDCDVLDLENVEQGKRIDYAVKNQQICHAQQAALVGMHRKITADMAAVQAGIKQIMDLPGFRRSEDAIIKEQNANFASMSKNATHVLRQIEKLEAECTKKFIGEAGPEKMEGRKQSIAKQKKACERQLELGRLWNKSMKEQTRLANRASEATRAETKAIYDSIKKQAESEKEPARRPSGGNRRGGGTDGGKR